MAARHRELREVATARDPTMARGPRGAACRSGHGLMKVTDGGYSALTFMVQTKTSHISRTPPLDASLPGVAALEYPKGTPLVLVVPPRAPVTSRCVDQAVHVRYSCALGEIFCDGGSG